MTLEKVKMLGVGNNLPACPCHGPESVVALDDVSSVLMKRAEAKGKVGFPPDLRFPLQLLSSPGAILATDRSTTAVAPPLLSAALCAESFTAGPLGALFRPGWWPRTSRIWWRRSREATAATTAAARKPRSSSRWGSLPSVAPDETVITAPPLYLY